MRNPFEALWNSFTATKGNPDGKKLVSFRVNEQLWNLYTAKTATEGKTVQDSLEKLIEEHLRRELRIEK